MFTKNMLLCTTNKTLSHCIMLLRKLQFCQEDAVLFFNAKYVCKNVHKRFVVFYAIVT